MKVINKKARFDYDVLETVEAGIVLTGSEAKSAQLGQVDLGQAHVRVGSDVAEIINLHIHPYKFADNADYDPTRTRKLLLNKKQMLAIANKTEQKGLTVIPTAMYTRGSKIKLEIALARGKKMYQKREAIKRHDLDLEMQRELRPKDR